MIGYASATGTRRNLAGLEAARWRLLFTPFSTSKPSDRFAYALDNGAWTSFQQGRPFDERAFGVHLTRSGAGADWCVIPDVVAGGTASLAFSLLWMRRVLDACGRGLLAVQNGMVVDDVAHLIGPRVGVFVGGSTAWKLSTMEQWATLARVKGAWCHVGRVNTVRRIRLCSGLGVTSFDGTSCSKFAVTIPKLSHARDQRGLFHEAAHDHDNG